MYYCIEPTAAREEHMLQGTYVWSICVMPEEEGSNVWRITGRWDLKYRARRRFKAKSGHDKSVCSSHWRVTNSELSWAAMPNYCIEYLGEIYAKQDRQTASIKIKANIARWPHMAANWIQKYGEINTLLSGIHQERTQSVVCFFDGEWSSGGRSRAPGMKCDQISNTFTVRAICTFASNFWGQKMGSTFPRLHFSLLLIIIITAWPRPQRSSLMKKTLEGEENKVPDGPAWRKHRTSQSISIWNTRLDVHTSTASRLLPVKTFRH